MSFCLVYVVKFGPISVLYALKNKKGISLSTSWNTIYSKRLIIPDLFCGGNFGLRTRSPGLESCGILDFEVPQPFWATVCSSLSWRPYLPCVGRPALAQPPYFDPEHLQAAESWEFYLLNVSPSHTGSGPHLLSPESLQAPPSWSLPSILMLLQGIFRFFALFFLLRCESTHVTSSITSRIQFIFPDNNC